MAWLMFSRTISQLALYAGTGVNGRGAKCLGHWKAHNEVTTGSKGCWPTGVYEWSHYNPHSKEPGFGPGCFSTSNGCLGIHVFKVDDRSGMGVHAGRQKNDWREPEARLGGRTLGCIRTSEQAMYRINSTHNSDPLRAIVVGP
jgi:hypothetical protein